MPKRINTYLNDAEALALRKWEAETQRKPYTFLRQAVAEKLRREGYLPPLRRGEESMEEA